MKSTSTVVSWIALAGVAVLAFFHFTHTEALKKQISVSRQFDSTDFRIAYFDIDTLQLYFREFQDAESQMKAKETTSRKLLNEMNVRYQKRLTELQEKARTNSMSQAEGEAAQRELARMENEYRQKDATLDQELKKMQMDLMNTLNKKVEEFLKVYNQDHSFAYVFSYQPGMLMYYRDTIYDITQDMIKGLNAQYQKAR